MKRDLVGLQALSLPKEEYLGIIRDGLMACLGRKVAVTLKRKPRVSILGEVVHARYVPMDDCVELALWVGNGITPLLALLYPNDIREYFIYGVRQDLGEKDEEVEDGEASDDIVASFAILPLIT